MIYIWNKFLCISWIFEKSCECLKGVVFYTSGFENTSKYFLRWFSNYAQWGFKLLHPFEPITKTFSPFWLRYLQKTCFLNAAIVSWSASKRCFLNFFLCTGIKRSHLVTSQNSTASDRCGCLGQCARARIAEVKNAPFSSIGFSYFLKNNW